MSLIEPVEHRSSVNLQKLAVGQPKREGFSVEVLWMGWPLTLRIVTERRNLGRFDHDDEALQPLCPGGDPCLGLHRVRPQALRGFDRGKCRKRRVGRRGSLKFLLFDVALVDGRIEDLIPSVCVNFAGVDGGNIISELR